MSDADCHYGDHRYGAAATCSDCGHFNAGLMQWRRIERAMRDGRHHGDHFHNTLGAASTCTRPTHDAIACGNEGGCYRHEASA